MKSTQFSAEQLIQFQSNGESLQLTRTQWQSPLRQAKLDSAVNIRHAKIPGGDPSYRKHVAAIPQQVGCHFHAVGEEDYAVVEGKGTLFFGKVTNGVVSSENWRSIDVQAGDSFVIPEGYAHQLRKTGTNDLTILFGCPDAHLDNEQDRTLLPDAPLRIN